MLRETQRLDIQRFLKASETRTQSPSPLCFAFTAVLAPLPYLLGFFGIYYLVPILIWSSLLLYASARLVSSAPTVENVKKYERLITMSMMLLILSLVLEAFVK